ncbi:hypothetical protein [Aeromicrobium sp. P5_D10]
MADDTESPGADSPAPHRFAAYSVALGVGAFACLFFFPFGCLVLGVPAITTGVHARREIAASRGELTGDEVAVIGLIIGGAALLTGLVSFLLSEWSG